MRASGPLCVFELRLGVCKDILPVAYLCSNKYLFVTRISLRSQGYHIDDVSLATLHFGDITEFKTAVFVCLFHVALL